MKRRSKNMQLINTDRKILSRVMRQFNTKNVNFCILLYCGVCQILNFFSHSKSILNFLSNCVSLYLKRASQVTEASRLTKPGSICVDREITGPTCSNFIRALQFLCTCFLMFNNKGRGLGNF